MENIYFTSIENFMSETENNVDDALDLAISYCSTHNCNVIKLASGGRYPLYKSHSVPDNITFLGDRTGHFQHGSTSYGPVIPIDPAYPKDSAFLWYGPTDTTWFNCENQVTFDGIVLGAPLQNWSATSKAQLIDYGTAIKSKTNTNILSCVYYGMRNFIEATGQTQIFKENVGFAYECDYKIKESRDINQIINCYSTPGVIRAKSALANCIIDDNSIFVSLENHDGTHIQNCLTFAKKIAIKNAAAANYIGHVLLNVASFDQVGIVLDNNPTGSGAVIINDVFAVGGSAADFGSSTPPIDSAFIVLRKQSLTSIASVTLSNCRFNLAASPKTAHPLYAINFQANQGYTINISDVECSQPTDNGAGVFCTINGTVTAAATSHTAQPIRENLIPNASWSWRHPSHSQPRGWTFTNCTFEVLISRRVTATGSDAVFGTSFRQDTGSRTYIFTATSIASSSGVTIYSTAADGIVTTSSGSWVRKGGKYYCTIYIATGARYHDIKISAGNSGSTITLEYAALVSGSVNTYGIAYNERPPKATQTGVTSYSIQLAGGSSHTFYPDYAGKTGSYRLYISSSIGAMMCRLIKLNPTSSPVITVEEAVYSGSNSFTVTWPDNSTPIVLTTSPTTLYLTLTGASYLSDF
ncbi:hypothetical protein ACI2JR_02460 [Klebsiella sp. NPDC088457]